MRRSRTLHFVIIGLAMIVVACAEKDRVVTIASAANDDVVQTQSSETTVQSFIAVEGADLMAKLDAAQTKARAKQTPYWSAYAFDVRSGVAVDAAIREFHGSINTIGDTSVMVGTTAGGVTLETPNLAVFLLRNPAANQITRMESTTLSET